MQMITQRKLILIQKQINRNKKLGKSQLIFYKNLQIYKRIMLKPLFPMHADKGFLLSVPLEKRKVLNF